MGDKKKLRRKMRNLEKEKQSDYEVRKDLLVVDLKEASKKHKIYLVAIIRPTEQGIYPLIAFVDVKDKMAEIEAAEKAKKAAKPKLEV